MPLCLLKYTKVCKKISPSFFLIPSLFGGGPVLYFHLQAVKMARSTTDFLSTCHLEYVYATLTAWGMHRLSSKGAKLVDFSVFQAEIIKQKSIDIMKKWFGKSIDTITPSELDEFIEDMKLLYDNVKINTSASKLVSFSKLMANILPDLFPPIDRKYTLSFFSIKFGKIKEKAIMEMILRQLYVFYCNPSYVTWAKSKIGGFNTSLPKIFDNLIIMYEKGLI